jgi:hypothetical protein
VLGFQEARAGHCFTGARLNSLFHGRSLHLLRAVDRVTNYPRHSVLLSLGPGDPGKSSFSGIPYVFVSPLILTSVILSYATGTWILRKICRY